MSNQNDDSGLPEEVKKVVEDQNTSSFTKTAKISSDGRQLLVRIPSKIKEALEIQKGEKIEFTAILDNDNPENDQLKMEYLTEE